MTATWFLFVFLYASRGQREKIDSRLFQYRPEQIIDGDAAYWLGGIYALLGDRQRALDWLKRAVALGNVNYPWFQRGKNYINLRADSEYQTVMAGVQQRWEAYEKELDVARQAHSPQSSPSDSIVGVEIPAPAPNPVSTRLVVKRVQRTYQTVLSLVAGMDSNSLSLYGILSL